MIESCQLISFSLIYSPFPLLLPVSLSAKCPEVGLSFLLGNFYTLFFWKPSSDKSCAGCCPVLGAAPPPLAITGKLVEQFTYKLNFKALKFKIRSYKCSV